MQKQTPVRTSKLGNIPTKYWGIGIGALLLTVLAVVFGPELWDAGSAPNDAALHDIWTRPVDGMVMVYVPGGTFMMGSTDTEIDRAFEACEQELDGGECQRGWFEDESPQHEVKLDGFWIDRTEVTNAQYAQCVADGTCRALSYTNDTMFNGDEYPVVDVSWKDADNYCRWADAQLPTEAQWEYAARGHDGRIYPWGDEFDGLKANYCDSPCPFSWKDIEQDDGYETTAPVGSYSPAGDSWVGAADMAGNVWEWAADWYGNYSNTPQTNPTGPTTGDSWVLRGGSFYFNPSHLRAAFRLSDTPVYRFLLVGFRCVVVLGS